MFSQSTGAGACAERAFTELACYLTCLALEKTDHTSLVSLLFRVELSIFYKRNPFFRWAKKEGEEPRIRSHLNYNWFGAVATPHAGIKQGIIINAVSHAFI